jgi:hypothetical protein
MIEWLERFRQALTWNQIGLGLGLFFASLIVSFAAIAVVMINIPAHYFSSHYEQDFLPNSHWTVKWGAVILKNLLGVFLIALGILLSLPGIPGQGLLTILLGIIMLDIPGKRPFEVKIIQRPAILSSINKLRARFNKPPLVLD